MLNLTPKKEESRTFKSLQATFSKVGTLLKKGRATSLAENLPQSSPSPTKKPLGFPDTPTWKANRSPTTTTPQPKQEGVNSMGVRWSRVEYAPVYIGNQQRPILAKHSATPEPDMEGHLVQHSTTEDEQFDIAVPVPIPPKEPEYLKIVAHIPAKQLAPMPPHHTYENSELDPKGEHTSLENKVVRAHLLRCAGIGYQTAHLFCVLCTLLLMV